MRLWTTDDRRWGVWAGVHAAEPVAGVQRRHLAPVPGDQLHAGGVRELPARPRARRRVPLEPPQRRASTTSRTAGPTPSRGAGTGCSRTFGVERERLRPARQGLVPHQGRRDKDDNPDITDYYGYGSLTAIYKWRDHSFSLMGRGNLSKGKGAAELTWMSPRAPRTAARLRAGLHRLRREPDRLQLEPEHDRRSASRSTTRSSAGALPDDAVADADPVHDVAAEQRRSRDRPLRTSPSWVRFRWRDVSRSGTAIAAESAAMPRIEPSAEDRDVGESPGGRAQGLEAEQDQRGGARHAVHHADEQGARRESPAGACARDAPDRAACPRRGANGRGNGRRRPRGDARGSGSRSRRSR